MTPLGCGAPPTYCAGLPWVPAPQRCNQSGERLDRALSVFPTTAESHEPAKLPASSLGMHPRVRTPARARPLPAPRHRRNLPVGTASGPPTGGRRFFFFFFNAIKFNIYKNNPMLGAKMTGHTRNSLLLIRRKTHACALLLKRERIINTV